MGVMLDTPDAIEWYRRKAVLARLKMEMNGLRFRINTFAAARRELKLAPRTPRKKVLELYEAHASELDPKIEEGHQPDD